MNRLRPIVLTIIAIAMLRPGMANDDVDLRELDIAQLSARMDQGTLSSEALVQWYLREMNRIDSAGPQLNAVLEFNPEALDIARALDLERQRSGARGPLHGIPVLLKANIDTGDRMSTSAGSLALQDHIAPDDAFLVARLREAGAVILGKANLSEWANFRSDHSSSGWSSLGGQTRNAYDPQRNPCGSSSGSAVAVAANLSTVAVGTETWGSVVCPSGINGIVGIKPTVGLVSRDGIIPISHTQDTAGPMARTVRDAAVLLNVMSAADPTDKAMKGRPEIPRDYSADLSSNALRGVRIGVLRNYSGAGRDPHGDAVFEAALGSLRNAGALLVDPVEIKLEGIWEDASEVLYYEFKEGLNQYLENSNAPVKSLEALIEFNQRNATTVMPFFAQEVFLEAQARGDLQDERYLLAVNNTVSTTRTAIDTALREHQVAALVAPTNSPAWLTDRFRGDLSFGISSSSFAAISGYASITVPAGFAVGLPVGLTFFAGAYSEKTLIELAYAFEQQSKARRDTPW